MLYDIQEQQRIERHQFDEQLHIVLTRDKSRIL